MLLLLTHLCCTGRMNERTWHITIAKSVAIIGFITACATLNTGARYFAMCLFSVGVYACHSIILGWVAATCGQTKEKKAVSLAVVNTFATLSQIWTAVSFKPLVHWQMELIGIFLSISGPRLMHHATQWRCQLVQQSRLVRLR